MYTDKTLKCKECGSEFIFTAGEQEFYANILPPSALPAAMKLRFPLSRSQIVLFTAAIASQR